MGSGEVSVCVKVSLSGRPAAAAHTASLGLTCLMAVTVMTKKSGSPLVTGLVGVSMIS